MGLLDFLNWGGAATYNYIRTLKKYKEYNYLFVLDDMVRIPTGGSYYLGSNGDYWGLDAIPRLIKFIKGKQKNNLVVTIGSSKGGTCAILYGLMTNVDYIIAGACQYRIGSYLNCPYHINSLHELTGKKEVGFDDIKELDDIMINTVRNSNSKKTRIYLHYSDQEHTYKEHIEELLKDLKDSGYVVYENVEKYVNHGDVGKYFPQYMCGILSEISSTYTSALDT